MIQKLRIGIGIVLVAAAVGASVFFALTNQYAYRTTLLQLRSLQFAVTSTPLLKYGVVSSIQGESLSVQYANGQLLQIRMLPTTYIAREDLTSENGVYTGVSVPTPATISDIRTGDKVATIARRDSDGTLFALVVLFGNPL